MEQLLKLLINLRQDTPQPLADMDCSTAYRGYKCARVIVQLMIRTCSSKLPRSRHRHAAWLSYNLAEAFKKKFISDLGPGHDPTHSSA